MRRRRQFLRACLPAGLPGSRCPGHRQLVQGPLAGRIVPPPLASGPSQVVSAVRSAIAMAVLLPPRSACSHFPIAGPCDPPRSCSLVLAPGDLDPPVVGAVFQVDEAVAARGELVDPPPRGIRVSAGLQLHPLAVVQP